MYHDLENLTYQVVSYLLRHEVLRKGRVIQVSPGERYLDRTDRMYIYMYVYRERSGIHLPLDI